jgi:hypothetical protein
VRGEVSCSVLSFTFVLIPFAFLFAKARDGTTLRRAGKSSVIGSAMRPGEILFRCFSLPPSRCSNVCFFSFLGRSGRDHTGGHQGRDDVQGRAGTTGQNGRPTRHAVEISDRVPAFIAFRSFSRRLVCSLFSSERLAAGWLRRRRVREAGRLRRNR